MPVLGLQYRDYRLQISYNHESYYTRAKFQGKTLHQILFERLIDGKIVSPAALNRELPATLRPSETTIMAAINGIEQAIKKSPDKRLREMRFLRRGRGGARPVKKGRQVRKKAPPPKAPVIRRRI